jgi:hypothetical protein
MSLFIPYTYLLRRSPLLAYGRLLPFNRLFQHVSDSATGGDYGGMGSGGSRKVVEGGWGWA